MPGPAMDVIRQFGEVEDDQRYTRLLDLFTDDAVYYDPFLGAQRGKPAIRSFMEHMEKVVPASGARFESWETEADTTCGWARWVMVMPDSAGQPTPIPGQSLYRLRDGKVSSVVDYVDARAFGRLRPGSTRSPDAAGAAGIAAAHGAAAANGAQPALDLVRRFWQVQDGGDHTRLAPLFGDARGITFELVDCAGDTTVAWSQWWCHFPDGRLPGWTLHTVGDGAFTLDADYFDTVAAGALRGPAGG